MAPGMSPSAAAAYSDAGSEWWEKMTDAYKKYGDTTNEGWTQLFDPERNLWTKASIDLLNDYQNANKVYWEQVAAQAAAQAAEWYPWLAPSTSLPSQPESSSFPGLPPMPTQGLGSDGLPTTLPDGTINPTGIPDNFPTFTGLPQ